MVGGLLVEVQKGQDSVEDELQEEVEKGFSSETALQRNISKVQIGRNKLNKTGSRCSSTMGLFLYTVT